MSSPARHRISLRVRHPVMGCEEISEGVGLVPRISYSAGDKKPEPQTDGAVGIRAETFWSHEWASHGSFEEDILNLSNYVSGRRDFLKSLLETGGRVEYFIGWFMSKDEVFCLDHRISRIIAEFAIDLVFDVYVEC